MQPTDTKQEQTSEDVKLEGTQDTSSNGVEQAQQKDPAEETQSTAQEPVGQVEETEEEEPVVQAAPVPPVVTTAVVTEPESVSDIQVLFNKIKVDGTPTEQALIKALEAYVFVMAPGKPVEPNTGALQQHTLWQNLRFTIQSSPEGEFSRLWNIVLAFAHQHKDGAFHERYIMRFSEDWHYDLEELTAFQRLINLIKLTADYTKREASLKQVDINRTLEKGFSDHGRTRLISFYS